jgi:cystathionine beta-lyase
MRFNFDEVIPRRGTGSHKWDAANDESVLPLWVADMDFRTAPAIIEALAKRAEHGIFGYTHPPQAYYDAVTGWFNRRHGFNIKTEWILYTTGVVPAISAVIKALTQPDDKVLIQTPVYNSFFSSIRNNGCETAESPLICKQGAYTMDFDDLERKAADPKVKVMLLCSPHNPIGRVWTTEELRRVGDICLRNNVFVVSDEIHCDLAFLPHVHTPFAALGKNFRDNSVTLTAPSKTFNLAGIQVANIVAPDNGVRQKIDRALNINEVCEINAFAIEALIAAYNDGEEWLEALKNYLHSNYMFLEEFFRFCFPHLPVMPLEATYLVWIDLRSSGRSSKAVAEWLLKNEKVWINDGSMYGAAGNGFIRINIATQHANLIKGINAIRNCLRQ